MVGLVESSVSCWSDRKLGTTFLAFSSEAYEQPIPQEQFGQCASALPAVLTQRGDLGFRVS